MEAIVAKTAIIYYSNTGHTHKLADRIHQCLMLDQPMIDKIRLETIGKPIFSEDFTAINDVPEVEQYHLLLFGSPVWGGRVSAPMNQFLKVCPSLSGKDVILFATHFLAPKTGLNQVFQSMSEICESKGARILGTGGVRWSSLRRNKEINTVAQHICSLAGK
jgi:flavodoxin